MNWIMRHYKWFVLIFALAALFGGRKAHAADGDNIVWGT